MFVLRAETFVVVRPDKSAAASCHLCSIILYIRPDSSFPTLRRRTSLQVFLSVVLMGTERSWGIPAGAVFVCSIYSGASRLRLPSLVDPHKDSGSVVDKNRCKINSTFIIFTATFHFSSFPLDFIADISCDLLADVPILICKSPISADISADWFVKLLLCCRNRRRKTSILKRHHEGKQKGWERMRKDENGWDSTAICWQHAGDHTVKTSRSQM